MESFNFLLHTFQNKIFPIAIFRISEICIVTQACYSSLIISFLSPLPIYHEVLLIFYIFLCLCHSISTAAFSLQASVISLWFSVILFYLVSLPTHLFTDHSFSIEMSEWSFKHGNHIIPSFKNPTSGRIKSKNLRFEFSDLFPFPPHLVYYCPSYWPDFSPVGFLLLLFCFSEIQTLLFEFIILCA